MLKLQKCIFIFKLLKQKATDIGYTFYNKATNCHNCTNICVEII